MEQIDTIQTPHLNLLLKYFTVYHFHQPNCLFENMQIGGHSKCSKFKDQLTWQVRTYSLGKFVLIHLARPYLFSHHSRAKTQPEGLGLLSSYIKFSRSALGRSTTSTNSPSSTSPPPAFDGLVNRQRLLERT